MPRQRKADRRPEWAPHYHWCCRVCQEAEQLRALAQSKSRAMKSTRKSANRFLCAMEDVANGQYGGIELHNLFD